MRSSDGAGTKANLWWFFSQSAHPNRFYTFSLVIFVFFWNKQSRMWWTCVIYHVAAAQTDIVDLISSFFWRYKVSWNCTPPGRNDRKREKAQTVHEIRETVYQETLIGLLITLMNISNEMFVLFCFAGECMGWHEKLVQAAIRVRRQIWDNWTGGVVCLFRLSNLVASDSKLWLNALQNFYIE